MNTSLESGPFQIKISKIKIRKKSIFPVITFQRDETARGRKKQVRGKERKREIKIPVSSATFVPGTKIQYIVKHKAISPLRPCVEPFDPTYLFLLQHSLRTAKRDEYACAAA